jgi:hypothetical protein
MEGKIFDIVTDLVRGDIGKEQAISQLLVLYSVSERTFDIHSCINQICDVIEEKTVTIRKPCKDGSLRYGIKKAIDAMLYVR